MNNKEFISYTLYIIKKIREIEVKIDIIDKAFYLLDLTDQVIRDIIIKSFNNIDTEISLYIYEIRRNCQIILFNPWILCKTNLIDMKIVMDIYDDIFVIENYLEKFRGLIVKLCIITNK